MRTLTGVRVFALGCFVAGLASAETVAVWSFDDGTPTDAASALVTEANAPTLNATAAGNGYGSAPTFNADVPGPKIYSRFGGPLLNSTNTASLRFINAGLANNNDYSHDGGRVTVPDNDPLLRATNMTVEVFVKVDRRVWWPLIVGKAREDGGGTSWNIDMTNDGRPRIRIDSDPLGTSGGSGWNRTVETSVNIEDAKWHHIAFTYNYADRAVKLYVDYVLSGQGNSPGDLVYDTRELRIGEGAGGQAFDGWIDEVRLSNEVLTPDLFMTVKEYTSTRGYWMFEDGASGATADKLANPFYTPVMDGTAESVGGAKPVFSSERPPATTSLISDGKGGPVVNSNAGSLFFVNDRIAEAPWAGGGQVAIPGSLGPAQMTNFTAEAFVKVNRHVGYPQIIGKTRDLTYGLSWSLALNANGNLRARFDTQIPPDGDGGNQTFESEAFVEDGLWHHVAITYDYPTQHVSLYRDYVKVLDGTTLHPLVTDSGAIKVGAGDQSFDGWIDEVRLTDRVLAPTEFLYTVPLSGTMIQVR